MGDPEVSPEPHGTLWGGGTHLMKQARAAPAAMRAETRTKMRRTKVASTPGVERERGGRVPRPRGATHGLQEWAMATHAHP